jgi:hypothetical protein
MYIHVLSTLDKEDSSRGLIHMFPRSFRSPLVIVVPVKLSPSFLSFLVA